MDPVQIAALIEQDSYDPTTAAKLESYVNHQLQSRSYDYNANKFLLKIYQFSPDLAKIETISNILILSLLRLPQPDYLSLTYLLPPKSTSQSRIQIIQKCASLLDSGRYTEFWEEYINAPPTLFSSINGFVEFIRRFIMGNLRDTYSAIPKPLFLQQLGLNDATFEQFCNGNKYIEKVKFVNIYSF